MSTPVKPGFRIVLLPELPPGTDRDQAVDALAEKFGIRREKASAFLGDKPRTIKTGLSQQQALQFQRVISACGLKCRLEWVAPEPAEPQLEMEVSEPPVAQEEEDSDLPVCPACGYRALDEQDPLITAFGGQGQCPACNIIVAKYGREKQDPPPKPADVPRLLRPEAGDGKAQQPVAMNGGSNGLLSGRGKMVFGGLGLVALCFIVFLFVGNGSSPEETGTSSEKHVSHNDRAAEAARAVENPGYAGPGPDAADGVQQDVIDRIEALETRPSAVKSWWFDEVANRIDPGEDFEGNVSVKLSFETVYLTIPPHVSSTSFGDHMYKDLHLQVDRNPWAEKGIQILVTGNWVTGYDFNIWVMAENGRVTSVLYPSDNTMTLEDLGRLSTYELREIEFSRKSGLPSDFDPVFDLTRGWAHGSKLELGLVIAVPESFADYTFGKYVAQRVELVYIKDPNKKDGPNIILTMGKRKDDPALYFSTGDYVNN